MSPHDTSPFAGLSVATFEARVAGPMAGLIARYGGVPVEAPALREIPLDDDSGVAAFAESLLAGEADEIGFGMTDTTAFKESNRLSRSSSKSFPPAFR